LEYKSGSGISVNIAGLLSPQTIQTATEEARKLVQSGDLPWVGILVWGNRDVPISFHESEHDVLWSGENDYIILLTKDTQVVYVALGQLDQYS